MPVPDKGGNPWLSAPLFPNSPLRQTLMQQPFTPRRRAPTPASSLPGLPTLPGSTEETRSTATAEPTPYAPVRVSAAWPRSSRWGAGLSHYCADRVMADAEFCSEGARALRCCKRADGRFLFGRQFANPKTVAWAFTGRTPRRPPRIGCGFDAQVGERNARTSLWKDRRRGTDPQ